MKQKMSANGINIDGKYWYYCSDCCGQRNLYGEVITRTKYSYSYEEFIQYKSKDWKKTDHAVYSDRLLQWDWDKHDNLCEKHFGNKGQYWSGRDTDKIEAFLQDYYIDSYVNLKLTAITEGCNVGNGYPYWVFYFTAERLDGEKF